MQYEIRNRFAGDVQFVAEIDCDEDALDSLKKGLAVQWALKRGANLRLADLIGADLSGADLSGADPEWANLEGARIFPGYYLKKDTE